MVKPEPSVLPWIESVWVRVCQVDGAGTFRTTWSTLVAVPRSTRAHCGKLLFALSQ